MTILSTFGGASGVDTGDIPASLRFRGDSVNCNLTRTPTAGNLRKWTISGWVKRSALTANFPSLFSATLNASFNDSFYFDNTDALVWSYSNTGTALASSAKYRDPTAFLHVVAVWDTDNATASNRARIYVNGVELTSFTTDNRASIANRDSTWNQAVVNYVGGSSNSALAMRGYMARFCFVEGQALTPSSFGYLNTEINEWVSKSQAAVKAVVDAGGTNSFMLDFDDGTSLTTLGYDKSSKGNNWTLNNFSLTAGTSYDRMLDVPGNSFATIGALSGFSASNTLSDGNLKHSSASVVQWTKTHQAMTTGKWYWEMLATTQANSYPASGLWRDSAPYAGAFVGNNANGVGYFPNDGKVWNNNTGGSVLATFATNDVIGFAFDADSGKFYVSKNGTWLGSADPVAGTNPALSGLTQGDWCPVVSNNAAGATVANMLFGQAPLHASATYDSASGGYFRYTPPSGYKALCQRNMPDPAILNPELHMDVVTRTGTAATYSVAGLGFQPDLVWVKSRGRAVDHALYDSVRGVQKQLESNQTGVETTESTGLTAFNSGGYTGGALDQINGTTATNSFVDWLWKAGGAAVTNNAGSISSQVSANVEAGFSIVTYTGTGANATVGHGLGRAPGLVIVKGRNAAWNWVVYNGSIGAGNYLSLNSTIAAAADSTMWNSTAPTSTVFSVGTNGNANGSASTYVAYCFAEIPGFSKIFSYTGNGSADGPFVHCGFKPKFILLKNASTTAHWIVLDTVRNTYNIVDNKLAPSSSSYENDPSPVGGAGTNMVDVLSNGFKLRHTDTPTNGNTYTYIGIAFADVPGKYSLAR